MITADAAREIVLECARCGSRYTAGEDAAGCPRCATTGPSNLFVVYPSDARSGQTLKRLWGARAPGMWRYEERLPLSHSAVVSLGEGGTPLLDCPNIGRAIGLPRLQVKNESVNPTWSFKDRLASVGVSWAKATGRSGIVLSSSGNAGAAAAAYAARAGLPCLILTTRSFPATMRGLMTSYGAMVLATETARDRWTLNRAVAREWGWLPLSNMADPPVGSHPIASEGHKTIAFEIAQALNWEVPDAVIVPVAYGDALAGIQRGFGELRQLGLCDREPRLVAAEAYGSLMRAMAGGEESPVPTGGTGSLALSAAAPQSTYQALAALRATGGGAVAVGNDEALEGQRGLAKAEGLFVELSAALTLAAASRLASDGFLKAEDRVVLLITSGGLKDLGVGRSDSEVPVVAPTLHDLGSALRRHFSFAA
ncbi:MAG: threonine synthase [Candidatus Nephthysia bennettiae]|uniref:Pyridoxal-phosphate dependent enzyme n=2 Tax=Candidatus Nephthysia bennettiae TaxID=3127016 RepID=A0A934K9I5_9BACT|nr:pyridoxal-phosphate dependent enzyme [Candidatus Dormibacteraeota bacterium]PZR98562.1 MAG: threonine synthase [Candidatus Dormibacteraeota bacterium]